MRYNTGNANCARMNTRYPRRASAHKRRCGACVVILCLFIAVGHAVSLDAGYHAALMGAGIEQQGEIPVSAPGPSLYSANAMLVDCESGAVMYEKRGTARMYPASMTKLMTAVITLERVSDLNARVVLNKEIFRPIQKANAVTCGFLPGESVRVIDLLYGLILASGAECAVGLAEYVAGAEGAFVGLMNEKAREIGMVGTGFTNAVGLHEPAHYSTAADIAALLRYALRNDTFYEIFTSAEHTVPATNMHEYGLTLRSTLFSKIDDAGFDGGSLLGGKTGYTDEAGQCLASLAVKDDREYVLVTAGADGYRSASQRHIDDAFRLYAAIDALPMAQAQNFVAYEKTSAKAAEVLQDMLSLYLNE